MKAGTRRALVRYLLSYAAAGGKSDFVERTQREIEGALEQDDRRLEALERSVEELERFHAAARAGGFSAVAAAPADVAAAALEREITIDEIADDLVVELMTAGGMAAVGGAVGDRLAIMLGGRELAGWGRGPLHDRVLEALRKAARPAPVLEAIEDDTITGLALAFRAIAADHEQNGDEIYSFAWKLAEYLEKPDQAFIATRHQSDRPWRSRRTR